MTLNKSPFAEPAGKDESPITVCVSIELNSFGFVQSVNCTLISSPVWGEDIILKPIPGLPNLSVSNADMELKGDCIPPKVDQSIDVFFNLR